MNLRLMKFVDYFFGIPICMFLSFFSNIYSKKPSGGEKKKIVLIQLSEMGAMGLMFPELDKLKNEHELYFVSLKRNREFIKLTKLVDDSKAMYLDDRSFLSFLVSFTKIALRLSNGDFSHSIDFELFSRISTIISFLTRSQNRIGFTNGTNEGLSRGAIINRPVVYSSYSHMLENYRALFERINSTRGEGYNKKKYNLNFRFYENFKLNLNKPIVDLGFDFETEKFIVVQPDVGDILSIRNWPKEYYLDLILKIQGKYKNLNIVMMSLKETKTTTWLGQQVAGKRFFDLTGKLKKLNDYFYILSKAKFLISSDSGPAHFAVLCHTPNIVFFGPETPSLYAPPGKDCVVMYEKLHCSPCLTAYNHRSSNCNDNICLKKISPEKVFEEFKLAFSN